MRSLSVSSLATLAVAMFLTAFTPAAKATPADPVTFVDNSPHPVNATVTLSTATTGATIFVKTDHYGFTSDPTHTGSTPTNGTFVYVHAITVPYGEGYNDPDAILYIKALAWKSGLTNSTVTSDVCDNRGQ